MISKDAILIAQNKWAQGLIAIGKQKENISEASKIATEVINTLYAYDSEKVLFKPTKAKDEPFRPSFEGALSYFVGRDLNFPEDKGFALEPWVDIQFKNSGFVFDETTAMAMGHYEFTNSGGSKVSVEYSFGYKLSKDNQLKITLHHSSLPYSG